MSTSTAQSSLHQQPVRSLDKKNMLYYIMRRLLLPFLASVLAPFALCQTPTWDQLKAAYSVQPLQDSAVKSLDRTAPEGTYTEFNFPGEKGDTVYATFIRPNAKGPFPLVVMLHGLGDSRQAMIDGYSKDFLKDGFAVLAVDAPHHGERATAADKALFQKLINDYINRKDKSAGLGEFLLSNDPSGQYYNLLTDAVLQGTRDVLRALSWITVPGHRVDAKRIGAFGISMGSIMSSILSGVDDQINADLLVIGGDPVFSLIGSLPADKQSVGYEGSSSLFLGHSTAHVLMLNGYNDQVMPRADTYRLYESAPGPVLVFYDVPGDIFSQFGHGIPREGYTFGEQWLEKMIDVPRPAARAHAKFGGG